MNEYKDYKQLKEISSAALLEESNHVRLILRGVLIVSVLLLILIVWASITQIKETAIAYGALVPEGEVQVIQHLEGGIVSRVLVKNGDEVKQGQVLVQLDPTTAQSELSRLRSRETYLTLNAERLKTFLSKEQVDVKKWTEVVMQSKYNPIQDPLDIEKLLQDQKQLLDSQYAKTEDQKSIIQNEIERQKEEKSQTEEELVVWQKQMKLLEEEYGMYKQLKSSNYISEKDYLTVTRSMNQAKSEGVRLKSQIRQIQESIEQSEQRLQGISSESYEVASKELNQVNSELSEVRHQLERLTDQVTRTDVKSPVPGIVQGIKVFPGNVVQSGGTLLEVVPNNAELVAECKILPRDIGHVKQGDEANVKVLTYDFSRYGSVKGKVATISADTFTDEEGHPFYKGIVKLEHQYVSNRQKYGALKPGMTVEVDIITGQKSLMQYLLKPIHLALEKSFRER